VPVFKHLQRASAAYMAFSHGRNDAQKPMGVLAMALALHYGWKDVTVPIWIVLSCASVAAVGTAYGGWRIIRTLGLRMTALDPVQGFAAEVAGASVIQGASELGIPISITHAITSSILGVGTVRRLSAVRWGVTFPHLPVVGVNATSHDATWGNGLVDSARGVAAPPVSAPIVHRPDRADAQASVPAESFDYRTVSLLARRVSGDRGFPHAHRSGFAHGRKRPCSEVRVVADAHLKDVRTKGGTG
jgi:Phosphate transporter family